jgi:transmembrane protein TMEM260 (protein O-mannosyltransferase)
MMPRRKSRRDQGTLDRRPARPGAHRESPRRSSLRRLVSAFSNRPAVSPINLKTEWVHLLVVFGALFGVYVYSAPRTVTLEDDGLFIMASYFLGVDHPPGYPLYTLLGKLFTLLPVGTVAFRVHLSSAFFGALTAVALWLVLRSLLGNAVSAYTGALLYGLSATFWSQAIIAESYTLNTFFFFSLFYLVLAFLGRTELRFLYVAAGVFGLSLANHWPLMLLSTPCLLLLLLPARREVLHALPRLLAIAIVACVLPYAWMVARSRMDPEISFYGPIGGLDSVLFFISRRGFRHVDVSQAAGIADKLHYLGFLLSEMVRQYTPLGAVLAGFGLVQQWRRLNLATAFALLAGWLGSSLVLGAMLGFDYEPLMTTVIRRYPLVAYGVLSIWLVLGLDALTSRARRGVLAIRLGAAAALAIVVFLSHRSVNVRRDDTWARDYATAVLSSVDHGAVVFVQGDDDAFPIGYLNKVEGLRPDVTLYNGYGLLFRNRLFRFDAPDQDRRLSAFVRDCERPVYYTTGSIDHEFSLEDDGLYWKVRKDVPGRTMVFELPPATRVFIERMEATTSNDPWALHQRDGLRRRIMGVLSYVKYYRRDVFLTTGLSARYDQLAKTPHGALGRLSLPVLEKADPSEFLAWVAETTALLEETGSKSERAWPPYMKGMLQLRLKQDAEAVTSLEDALRIYPSHKNPAALALLEYHSEHGNPTAFLDIGNRIFVGQSLDRPMTEKLLRLGARLGL